MTIDNILQIIKDNETRNVEFKKSTGELKDAMHSVCAMLNSDGGYVIFGISPQSLKIVGQQVTENTRQEIAREIRKIEPFVDMPVIYVDVPEKDGFKIIVLHADKNLYNLAPYVFDGKPFYRLESTTLKMPQTMYEERLRQRDSFKFRWESQIAEEYSISDLDEKRIREVVSIGIRSGRINSSADGDTIESILSHLHLVKDGKPTNAAVALFAKDMNAYPQIELRMACFKGTNKSMFIDNKIESGNIFDMLEAGVAFCFRNLKLSGEVVGMNRKE